MKLKSYQFMKKELTEVAHLNKTSNYKWQQWDSNPQPLSLQANT